MVVVTSPEQHAATVRDSLLDSDTTDVLADLAIIEGRG